MICVEKPFASTLATPQVLVQEFLVGTEYVVDTVSRDGDHKVFARDPEGQPFFFESAAVLCAPIPLSLGVGMLQVLGLRWSSRVCFSGTVKTSRPQTPIGNNSI